MCCTPVAALDCVYFFINNDGPNIEPSCTLPWLNMRPQIKKRANSDYDLYILNIFHLHNTIWQNNQPSGD